MGNCASGSLYAGKNGRTLDQYLAEAVFQDSEISVLNPEEEGVAGYRSFMERYTKGLSIERAAVENNVNERTQIR